jgi:hypothetical protein
MDYDNHTYTLSSYSRGQGTKMYSNLRTDDNDTDTKDKSQLLPSIYYSKKSN